MTEITGRLTAEETNGLRTAQELEEHLDLYRPSKLQCFGKINRFLDETT